MEIAALIDSYILAKPSTDTYKRLQMRLQKEGLSLSLLDDMREILTQNYSEKAQSRFDSEKAFLKIKKKIQK